VRIAVQLGVDKIRLTGGEPLVRKGFSQFLPLLTALEGLRDVSLTTNGVLLPENLDKLKTAGIRRINVSLDSLQADKYERITGFRRLEQVLAGLKQATQMGFHPVKINMVVIKGVNDDEILDLAELSLHHPYHIRFIEYMPLGTDQADPGLNYVPSAHVKMKLARLGKLIPVEREDGDGPAERFRFPHACGEIGFIGALSHLFCDRCNRIRLTASGRLRPCLLSDHELDLKDPLRSGASDLELARVFLESARQKPRTHGISPVHFEPLSTQMSSIGG
jgi:cyclic pyranopterin phosphate synthase